MSAATLYVWSWSPVFVCLVAQVQSISPRSLLPVCSLAPSLSAKLLLQTWDHPLLHKFMSGTHLGVASKHPCLCCSTLSVAASKPASTPLPPGHWCQSAPSVWSLSLVSTLLQLSARRQVNKDFKRCEFALTRGVSQKKAPFNDSYGSTYQIGWFSRKVPSVGVIFKLKNMMQILLLYIWLSHNNITESLFTHQSPASLHNCWIFHAVLLEISITSCHARRLSQQKHLQYV